ncbi:YbaY family lipoprotein [Labrys neptuniae]|uniref:YbaY family lipoprotein n=1 Tax=Labrys neptuniae TaxID=376174 RepID=UPI00288D3636|nr:YbaY family lipoprotein [Labrys neptuniae]MDT3375960.1 YbaY family lipoprotein [Labrys neptuniae]
MINRWRPLAIACALVGLMLPASEAFARQRTLAGTVSYRERIALPPTAVVEVKLVDVSLADAPARTLARTSVRSGRQVPIPYRLRYDDRVLKPSGRYAMEARISVNGRLWFLNTTHHAVTAGEPVNGDIQVDRVGQEAEAGPTGPSGRWLAEDINGRGVVDDAQSVLEIAADGKVSGRGGCNGMGGSAVIKGSRIRFGQIVSTQMACPPAIMDQEGKFLKALQAARSWRIDTARNKLLLLDARGRRILLLARM